MFYVLYYAYVSASADIYMKNIEQTMLMLARLDEWQIQGCFSHISNKNKTAVGSPSPTTV